MKHWLLLTLVCFTLSGLAQEKKLLKARAQYKQERYEKALSTVEKVLKHKDTRNSPEALILEAKILVALADDPEYPKALSDALKSAEKALRKSKEPEKLREKEDAFFLLLRDRCMQEATKNLTNQRYIQSDKYFTKVFDLYQWIPAKWGQAQVALALKDTATAMRISKELLSKLLSDNVASSQFNDPGPFVLVIDQYISKKQYDSASFYAELAANKFPESVVLRDRLLKSFLLFVTSGKPDLQTLELFASMRPRFKNDSLFIHKENVLFLYLMNRYAGVNNSHISDSLLVGYVDIKNAYYNEFGDKYRSKDPMYEPDNNELLFNLIRYTAQFERSYMLAMLLDNYVGGNYSDSSFRALKRPARWKTLFDRVHEEHSIFLLASSLTAAHDELKKEAWFQTYKKEQILAALNNPAQFKDRVAFYSFVPFVLKEYPKDKIIFQKTEALSLNIINEFTDSMWFSYARLSIRQHDRLFPQSEKLLVLKKTFVVNDFIENYYGSRLPAREVAGKPVPGFVWNGIELLCKEGNVPDSIQKKVEQRLNYFRRTAGVPDYVKLDTIKNAACQKAALIYQANTGRLFTEPAETWKCFKSSAVEAAMLSARVFGQTTVFAVTSIMADQGDDNISVGNRRWLLFPPAKNMGHGSTSKVSLIWTLDEGGDKDTTDYMRDFVSWPPRDFCPAMFAFPRWNFSMYADLSKAKVSMSQGGKPILVTQEKQVAGYGMPSLVWAPAITPEIGVSYTVKIDGVILHGEKKPRSYTYSVKFIDPMK